MWCNCGAVVDMFVNENVYDAPGTVHNQCCGDLTSDVPLLAKTTGVHCVDDGQKQVLLHHHEYVGNLYR